MRILITGGAGFIGSNLGLYLAEKKHKVILLDNLKYGSIDNFSENKTLVSDFVRMDIRDTKIEKILENIDVVFHLACIVSLPGCNDDPAEAYSVNVAGLANVLEMARRKEVKKFIFSSTSAVYENETEIPLKEESFSKPTLIYSQTKKAGEDLCQSYIDMYGMDITILRFFNVYGPGMDYFRPPSYLVSYLIKCLLRKEQPILHSDGHQSRDFVYVSDVVRLSEMVMTNPNSRNEVFNVGTGTNISVQDLFELVAKIIGESEIKPIYRSPKLIWEKFPSQLTGSYPINPFFLEKEVNKYTLASTKRAKKLLGWSAEISIEEGIKKTIDFAKRKDLKKILNTPNPS